MAILMMLAVPGMGTPEYGKLKDRIVGPTAAAPGFMGHAGYPGPDNTWNIAEIWGDADSQARVFSQHVRPHLPPGVEPQIQPLHFAIGAASAGTVEGAVLTMTVVPGMDAPGFDTVIAPHAAALPVVTGFRGLSSFAAGPDAWVLAETWDSPADRQAWFDVWFKPNLPDTISTQIIPVPSVFWPVTES